MATNISDIKGEEAIELCGDLLEPLCTILADQEFRELWEAKTSKIKLVQYLTKHHAKEVKWMLAILDREDPETYEVSVLTLPMKLIQLFNDPAVASLFPLQVQITEKTSSGSATENTEAEGN